jgi:hypothetical protein
VRIRETVPWLNEERRLAFSTVQAVMENLYRKGWRGQEAGEDAERRDLTVAYLAMRESC